MIEIIKEFVKHILSVIGKRNPELVVRLRYRMRFHKRLDLDNPITLNEKIQYMSLRTDTSEWSRLADKYAVREYVSACGLESILNKLYGVWDDASEIDFDSLPGQFILKTTNGSGYCIIVEDKNTIDRKQISNSLGKMMKTVYGLSEGNPHYSRIRPRVIAEELLLNDAVSAKYSRSIIDYKIWCFNGKACYIWVCTDRTHSGTDVLVYDTEWNAHPEYSRVTKYYRQGSVIPKPENFKNMLSMAEKLAAPFPVVRVDLYNIAGRILFGELTFTAVGGLMNCYTDAFLKMTGDMIRLPGRDVEN